LGLSSSSRLGRLKVVAVVRSIVLVFVGTVRSWIRRAGHQDSTGGGGVEMVGKVLIKDVERPS
jgi:hypothetical protein